MLKVDEMEERCKNCIYRFDGWNCDYFRRPKECIKVYKKCIKEDMMPQKNPLEGIKL